MQKIERRIERLESQREVGDEQIEIVVALIRPDDGACVAKLRYVEGAWRNTQLIDEGNAP